jgi:CRP/FNR family transcriptional regulator, nitrogen oxide reductase regulator
MVQRFALFSEIPLEDCASIVALAHEACFAQGKAIFFAGDPLRDAVLLTSGCVKLTQSSRDREEVILRLVGPGEALCVECFPTYSHCSTAWAVQPSTALVWETNQFQAIEERFPCLRRNVSCVIMKTLTQLEERFREISTERAAPRLSSQLLRLVDQFGKNSEALIEIAVTQRDLAQLIGTTLFTVNRLLNRWEEQGIVSPRREALLVLNIPALVELSQGE